MSGARFALILGFEESPIDKRGNNLLHQGVKNHWQEYGGMIGQRCGGQNQAGAVVVHAEAKHEGRLIGLVCFQPSGQQPTCTKGSDA